MFLYIFFKLISQISPSLFIIAELVRIYNNYTRISNSNWLIQLLIKAQNLNINNFVNNNLFMHIQYTSYVERIPMI